MVAFLTQQIFGFRLNFTGQQFFGVLETQLIEAQTTKVRLERTPDGRNAITSHFRVGLAHETLRYVDLRDRSSGPSADVVPTRPNPGRARSR